MVPHDSDIGSTATGTGLGAGGWHREWTEIVTFTWRTLCIDHIEYAVRPMAARHRAVNKLQNVVLGWFSLPFRLSSLDFIGQTEPPEYSTLWDALNDQSASNSLQSPTLMGYPSSCQA